MKKYASSDSFEDLGSASANVPVEKIEELRCVGELRSHLGISSAILCRSWPILARLGPTSDLSWADLGRSWARLGPILANLGPILADLGRSWPGLARRGTDLGPILGDLGRLKAL